MYDIYKSNEQEAVDYAKKILTKMAEGGFATAIYVKALARDIQERFSLTGEKALDCIERAANLI